MPAGRNYWFNPQTQQQEAIPFGGFAPTDPGYWAAINRFASPAARAILDPLRPPDQPAPPAAQAASIPLTPAIPMSMPLTHGAQVVQRLPNAPSEIGQAMAPTQNALMNLFNFPTLRKKPARASSVSTAPGQYNENFWNAWRF